MSYLETGTPWVRDIPSDTKEPFTTDLVDSHRSNATSKFVDKWECLLVVSNELDQIEVPLVVDVIRQVTCLEGVVCFDVVTPLFDEALFLLFRGAIASTSNKESAEQQQATTKETREAQRHKQQEAKRRDARRGC
jgi:hypothetical protein